MCHSCCSNAVTRYAVQLRPWLVKGARLCARTDAAPRLLADVGGQINGVERLALEAIIAQGIARLALLRRQSCAINPSSAVALNVRGRTRNGRRSRPGLRQLGHVGQPVTQRAREQVHVESVAGSWRNGARSRRRDPGWSRPRRARPAWFASAHASPAVAPARWLRLRRQRSSPIVEKRGSAGRRLERPSA
jgi:hypothetical protein